MQTTTQLNTVQLEVDCVSNDGEGPSRFTCRTIDLHGSAQRRLSEQIPALNFRMRSSDISYASDWHVAGDPTLLVVLHGTVRITLRSGEHKEFSAGGMFVAQDFLQGDVAFDADLHGHRAEVIGDIDLSVLHLKLDRQTT
jgi:hypothetical protein